MSGRVAAALEATWDRDGLGARVLAPLSWVFGAGVGLRNACFDLGLLSTYALGAPTVSIGNLSVGGTGKTPLTSWVARHLASGGRRPGILLRGYRGEDETLVHRELNPDAVVVADPDRVRGAARARAAGARVLVLDDGFQHRRARRDLDVVLVAAEQGGAHRLLPAGPLREKRLALARADVLVVTRKSADRDQAAEVATRWSQASEHLVLVVASLAPQALVRATSGGDAARTERALTDLSAAEVLAISAIGAPAAFEAQLGALGATVRAARFPDHHAFSDRDVAALARRAEGAGIVVCTLKDAVKLRGRWPRGAPSLWYLSQAVTVEWGEAELRARLDRLVPT